MIEILCEGLGPLSDSSSDELGNGPMSVDSSSEELGNGPMSVDSSSEELGLGV